jgi:hypothetical protein
LTELFEASDVMLHGRSCEAYEDAARLVKSDAEFKSRLLSNYLATRKTFRAAEVAEQEIHGAFPSQQDEYRRASFHDAPWPDALRLAQEMDHDGLRTFGTRVVYCEARSQMPQEIRRAVERELSGRLTEQTTYGFTLQQALTIVAEMVSEGKDREGVLVGYQTYLLTRQHKVASSREQLGLTSTPPLTTTL